MAYLKSVPQPSWLPTPRSGKHFKITLWLDPATYLLLMRKSTELEAGKISVHKWLKRQLGIENAKEVVQDIDGRSGTATTRHIHETTKLAVAARRRRQSRKVAA